MKQWIGAWTVGCAAACVVACSGDGSAGDPFGASDAGSGGRGRVGSGGATSAAGGARSSGGSQAGGRSAAGGPPELHDASLDGWVAGDDGAVEAGVPDASSGEPDGSSGEPDGGSTGGAGTGGVGAAGSGGASGVGGSGLPPDAGEPVDGGGDAGCDPVPEPWTVTSHLDAQGRLVAPTDGFQIELPTIDVAAGAEMFLCGHVTMPNAGGEFDVGEWESQQPPGSSEFVLYRADGDTKTPGTVTTGGCTQGFGGRTWLYTSSAAHSHLAFPSGVGMDLPPNQKVNFDIHLINTDTDTLHASIRLNARRARTHCGFQVAQAQVSFNTGIFIPPNGQQTVGGDCTPAPGAKYFYMTTKTHRRATLATVVRKLVNGSLGEDLVRTTQWYSPDVGLWETTPFLTFGAGEKFRYSCSYQNDRNAYTTVGTSADTNEWCSAISYYFPAGATTATCN